MDYQKLVDEQAAAMNVSTVPVKEQPFGNAATDKSTIFINSKFAAKIYSSSGVNGVRFVLAHELGHARGGAGGGHAGEYAADRWAAESVANKGIGHDAITGVMSNLNKEATETHPAAADRAAAAQSAWMQAVDMSPPKTGFTRAASGESVAKPVIKIAKPKKERYRAR